MPSMLSKHFSDEEMACPCCGLCEMNAKFMRELEDFRVLVGYPMRITSGMRCKKHNDSLPEAAKNSYHLVGKAADILWTKNRFMMLRIALAHFNGIGISKEFLHVDMGGNLRLWIY